ncbi:MAG: radical SAM protein [Candidatus Woesearchaeota archaeon]
MNLLKKTESICNECYEVVPAKIYEQEGIVYMKKRCDKHGTQKSIIETDAYFYKVKFHKYMGKYTWPALSSPISLTIPLTHKCNMSCNTCFFPFHTKDMNTKEIFDIIKSFKGECIRLSGGEPTLRKDLPEILKFIKNQGKTHSLLTNGVALADEQVVEKLKRAGLTTVNFTINSLRGGDYRDNTTYKRKSISSDILLRALSNLKKNRIFVVFSTLLVRGDNEDELNKIWSYYLDNPDFIVEWRIRAAVKIGRYTSKKPFFLSEMFNLICNMLSLDSKLLLHQFAQTKEAHRPFDCLDLYLYYLTTKDAKQLLFVEFNEPSYDNGVKEKIAFSRRLIANGGARSFFYYIKKRIHGDCKVNLYKIKLRRWPMRYDIDLDELGYCRSAGLCEDGTIHPFCYSLIRNEAVVKKQKNKRELNYKSNNKSRAY